MPLMIDLKRVTVFGGERGEGLQKTQKLASFADELLVVCEAPVNQASIDLPAGPQSELKENLPLRSPRSVPVHPRRAADLSEAEIAALVTDRSFVVSDLEDREINQRIKAACDQLHVLCTVVDTKDLCSAWFMGLVRTDHLTVALSTSGAADPSATFSFFVPRLREALTPPVAAQEAELVRQLEARKEAACPKP
jgi:siroheme synthase (precorrin-2 oxidase/ferrochelatase)